LVSATALLQSTNHDEDCLWISVPLASTKARCLKVSRHIPNSIKRKVRRACGFGCVFCGHPIFEYDHMVEFSRVKQHTVENLCCLCPTHHAEKTRGLITPERVKMARANPKNLSGIRISSHPFYFYGFQSVVKMGSVVNYFSRPRDAKNHIYTPLVVRNESLININFGPDDIILFDIHIRNKDDEIEFAIIENELVYKTKFWDIEFIGNRFVIKKDKFTILFQATLNMPNAIIIEKGQFCSGGSCVEVKENSIFFGYGGRLGDSMCANSRYGFVYNSREDFAPSCMYATD